MEQKSDLQNRICQRIDLALKRKGLKRKALASALDLTPSLISRMLNGQSTMNVPQLDKICTYLDIDISDLLYDSEKPDTTTYHYNEDEADTWCMDEKAIYVLTLLLKKSQTEKSIIDCMPDHSTAVKKILRNLKEKNLIIERPDGKIVINPPTFTSYNIVKSKKYTERLTSIINSNIDKYYKADDEWRKKSFSFSITNLNWFTDAQLSYIKEQLNNLDFVIRDFLGYNSRKKYQDSKRLQLILLNSVEVLSE